MKILEVPFPILCKGQVLVRNHYSIISAGTEGKTVADARLGYIGKAIARKEEVKKVITTAKTIGLANTYKLMMNKLDAPSALGYSCSGEIIAVAEEISEFKIGDRVACAGSGAVHAEVVAVSKNLCVKLPDEVQNDVAAFATLGAIALQGIRQADLRLGENCAVIGLGLLGQLTVQMLSAAGVKSFGIDVDKNRVELSKELGASHAFEREQDNIEKIINELTGGHGTDAVIITAGASSTDPIDFAGAICRKKGKVVVVGNIPTGFKRTNYYKKELELRMSCSYGPGRYDSRYEESGIDYPYSYVRWTENRNMQAFVELIKNKKINVKKLITHEFDFKNAPSAYQMIVDRTAPFIGILLKYDIQSKLSSKIEIRIQKAVVGEPAIGFIGAGAFANNVLLPALKGKCQFIGAATNKSNNARNIADKYRFSYCTDNTSELIADKNVNSIFVATRHDSHAAYVTEALKNKKHVFVEKPLCVTLEELESIKQLNEKSESLVMVGFNRRFAPQIQKARAIFKETNLPVAIHYRINAGVISPDHWIHDKAIGGGRIIGEVCHFVDLITFLANSKIKSLSANAIQDSHHLNDSLIINLNFENGSIATISYFSNGNKNLNKEYLEIFGSGQVAVINDFKEMTVYGNTTKKYNSTHQDKGHKNEVDAFLSAIRNGKESPIAFSEIYHSMLSTFKVEESIKNDGRKEEI